MHVEALMRQRTRKYKDMGLKLEISTICKELMDVPLFSEFQGDVYLKCMCFCLENRHNYESLKDPIKISSGEDTKTLTADKLLTSMSNAVPLESNMNSYHAEASQDMRPMYLCTEHNTVGFIEVHQFVKGVLLIMSFC